VIVRLSHHLVLFAQTVIVGIAVHSKSRTLFTEADATAWANLTSLRRLNRIVRGENHLPVIARSESLAAGTTWLNDHARFTIQSIDADGKLTGTYENTGANFGCAGQLFPVTG
jgi:hypothetical protein